MGHYGLADVGLPDAHRADAVFGHAVGRHQAARDGERTDRGGQVAAVARPVHEGAVDGNLAEQVVHVMAGFCRRRHDDGLGRGRRGAAHAVDLLAVGVRAADHAQQQLVSRRTWLLAGLGQVLQAEEHTLAGAAAHIGGGNANLCGMRHVVLRGSSVRPGSLARSAAARRRLRRPRLPRRCPAGTSPARRRSRRSCGECAASGRPAACARR
mmetsp:Transcript_26275/g.62214  ORF Transcript_26275/g.62214 Transcript_26275/m.62214 type:complete len:211 (+) Transcript_26275:3988-4620(+)